MYHKTAYKDKLEDDTRRSGLDNRNKGAQLTQDMIA